MFRRSSMRFAVTALLSYFLSFSTLLIITGVILLRTVVNPWYTVEHLEKSDFAEYARADMREIFISHGAASGVSSEIMETLITEEHIKKAVESSAMAAFGLSGGYNFNDYSNEVFNVISDYIEAQGILVTRDIETGIRGIAELCADSLKDYVNSPIFDTLARMQRYQWYIFIIVALSTLIAVTTVFLIPYINKRVTRWIDGYLYALGAASIICAAIPISITILGFTDRLQLSPLSYNKLITSCLQGIVDSYLMALIPLSALIIVCVAVRVWRWKRRRSV